jgi:nuclear control of ATPase protein 2
MGHPKHPSETHQCRIHYIIMQAPVHKIIIFSQRAGMDKRKPLPPPKRVLGILLILVSTNPSSFTCLGQKRFPGGRRGGGGGGLGGEPRDLRSSLPLCLLEDASSLAACRGGDTGNDDLLKMTKGLVATLGNIVLYKPPVGIVGLFAFSRLIFSGRLFRLDAPREEEASEKALQRASSQKRNRRRHRGRAFDLDRDDAEYQAFGGVERVRRGLCWAALNAMLEGDDEQDDHDLNQHFSFAPSMSPDSVSRDLIRSIVDVLRLSYSPGGSRTNYVASLLEPMARMEQNLVQTRTLSNENNNNSSICNKTATSGQSAAVSPDGETDYDRIVRMAAMTAEIRVLDGLLRVLRDRLLRTSFRLSRTQQHWRRKLLHSQVSYTFEFWRQVMLDSTEGDRLRLAFATSAYSAEIARLGRVIKVIMERPEGMDDSKLFDAVRYTAFSGTEDDKKSVSSYMRNQKPDWAMPKASKFSFQFNRDGRRKFHLTSFEDRMTVGGNGALKVLLADRDSEEWMEQARQWTSKVRHVLQEIIKESIMENKKPTAEEKLILARIKSWTVCDFECNEGTIRDQWDTIFARVENIHKDSRLGEGEKVRIRQTSLYHWFREWDLLGLPSTLACILLAYLANQWFEKNWAVIRKIWHETFVFSMDLFKQHLYIPIKDLVVDVMSREKSSLTGIALKDEETSLDNMLRDLEFGDGTPENRNDALTSAMRQYESDLRTGLLRHALGGRLVRLMLIQIQQLKVGALHAAETIDVLLQANKINLQLLAVIPGIMMVIIGTRLLSRFWFRFRSREIRSIRAVYDEMTEYINELEHLLLVADSVAIVPGESNTTSPRTPRQSLRQQQQLPLPVDELGEFTLLLYNYLVLLDYSSPMPFPNRKCDAIHRSVQDFLGANGSLYRLSGNVDRQIALIGQVKHKHSELSQYL